MPRICIFIKELAIGGAEKQSLLLTRELQSIYPTILVVLSSEQKEIKYLKFIEQYGLQVVFLRGSFLGKLVSFIRFLKDRRIDAIISFLLSNNIYAALAGHMSRVPYIIGGIRNSKIPKKKLYVQRFLHNHIQQYTIFNNYSGRMNLIKQGFRRDKIIVIHNCIDITNTEVRRKEGKEIVILTVTRFKAQKDLKSALDAVRKLVDEYSEVLYNRTLKYKLVGYGPEENELRAYVKQLSIENVVEFIISPQDTESLFKDADIYLSTSFYEGLSNSIMEAMSFYLPIVATDVGDNKYLVREGINGYLTPIGDAQKLADSLVKLIRSQELRTEFGQMSLNLLKQEFNPRIFKDRYHKFIACITD